MSHQFITHPQRNGQSGVTMLEMLIAILVLSFGLLGMLGLILNGLKMTSSSQYRTIAAQQVAAMAEVVNANPGIVGSYAPPSNTLTANCLAAAGCGDTGTIAGTEYALWLDDVGRLLPGGVGTVCLDSTPADGNSSAFACSGSGRMTIKVCWNEQRRVAISGGGVTGSDTSGDSCLAVQI